MNNNQSIFCLGIFFICLSLFSMIFLHEYTISGAIFLLAIGLTGIAFAKLPDEEKPPVNTKKMNENIQALNDLLWGEEEKK
jgi:hypothetical protein